MTGANLRLLDVPGGKIGAWEIGDGPPALILHGGPGLSDYTEGLARELATDFRTVRYQQRGLPPTTLAEPYTVEAHVADAIAVLDALDIDRAWAFGHSWGGHLAMHVAIAHPDRVLGVGVIDGLGAIGDGGAEAMERHMMAKLSPEEAARAQALDERAMGGEGTVDDAMEGFRLCWPYYFARPSAAPPIPAMSMSVACYAATWDSVKGHLAGGTLERGLRTYGGSAMVIHGKQSPIPYQVAVETAALMRGARLVLLEDCGHFTWMEKPGATRAALSPLAKGG